jgi:hypothetical protein
MFPPVFSFSLQWENIAESQQVSLSERRIFLASLQVSLFRRRISLRLHNILISERE